ncbi:MAG: hypothetical protein PHX30_05925 [Candidatus Pacebacteria bacterium]|nr:hypothetical protein [Candidatus Paceibacterota bacterium]
MCEDPDCENYKEEELLRKCDSQNIVDSFNSIVMDPCFQEIRKKFDDNTVLVKEWVECAKDGLDDVRSVFFEKLFVVILLKMTEGDKCNDKIVKILADKINSYQYQPGYCQEEEKGWYNKGVIMATERIPLFIKNLKI